MLIDYFPVLLFLVLGAIFVPLNLLIGSLVRPKVYEPEKYTSYECGEESEGHLFNQFNPRFYVIALIFVIFEVELVFLFPWALLLRGLGWYGDYHSYVADSRNRAQLGTDGWAADIPSPTDFTTPFTCASYRPRSPGNVNLSGFCDDRFERRIDTAVGARGAEADARWHEAYRYLARSAPAAPLVNRRGVVFTSERLGNYQHHPLFGVLLDQVWVR